MRIEDELTRFIEGQYEALGRRGTIDYSVRCLELWRKHYGDAVADIVAGRIRTFLQARNPASKRAGRKEKDRHGEGDGEVRADGAGEEVPADDIAVDAEEPR